MQIPYKIWTGFEAHGEQPKVDLCWSSALLKEQCTPYPVVRSHLGAVLGVLQPVEILFRIYSGRTASYGRNPTLEQGHSDHEGEANEEELWTDHSFHAPFPSATQIE